MDSNLILRCFNDSTDLSPSERLLLYVLACFRNSKTGKCNPSLETLSVKCGSSRRTVIRTLQQLKAKRLIDYTPSKKSKSDRGAFSSNSYSFPASGSVTMSLPNGNDVTTDSDTDAKRWCHSDTLNSNEIKKCEMESQSHTQGFDLTLTEDQYAQLKAAEVPRRFCDEILKRWEAAGGKAGSVRVDSTNVVERLTTWWKCERDKNKWLDAEGSKPEPRTYTPDDFLLCEEDGCIHYDRTYGCKLQMPSPTNKPATEFPNRPANGGCRKYVTEEAGQ